MSQNRSKSTTNYQQHDASEIGRRSKPVERYQGGSIKDPSKKKKKRPLEKSSKEPSPPSTPKKKRDNSYQMCKIKPAGNVVIWGKCKGHGYWPARIAKDSELDGDPEKPGDPTRWVKWYGDYKFSEIKVWDMYYFHDFMDYFNAKKYSQYKLYRTAILEALTEIAERLGKKHPKTKRKAGGDMDDTLINWAKNDFKPENKNDLVPKNYDMPSSGAGSSSSDGDEDDNDDDKNDSDNDQSKKSKKSKTKEVDEDKKEEFASERYDAIKKVRAGKKELDDICVGCGNETVKILHPLFKGGMCDLCENEFRDMIYMLDETNGGMYCCICGEGSEVLLCDHPGCSKSFCTFCVKLFASKEALDKELKSEPWTCFLCRKESRVGLLERREDWQQNLCHYIKDDKNSQQFIAVDIPKIVVPKERKGLRVLSLFDGIATGLVALKELGLKIDAYYSAEIDNDANMVVKNHHDGVCQVGDVLSITDKMLETLGPFDLLIGGSPCNDLSIVNPARKGIWGGTGQLFFEYVRIMNTCKLLACQQQQNFFWLFENVVSMDRENRKVIDRFLQRKGVVLDAKEVSPARRPRYFWGNLPGMFRPLQPTCNHRLDLNDCLERGRVSATKKIRTITTKSNSLPKDLIRYQRQSHNAYRSQWFQKNETINEMPYYGPDKLWITEIERVFGFPDHYTDVGDMSSTNRLRVIGKSWSVPVIKHIFAPLKEYFLSENEKSARNGGSSSSSSKNDADHDGDVRNGERSKSVEKEQINGDSSRNDKEKKGNGSLRSEKERKTNGETFRKRK